MYAAFYYTLCVAYFYSFYIVTPFTVVVLILSFHLYLYIAFLRVV